MELLKPPVVPWLAVDVFCPNNDGFCAELKKPPVFWGWVWVVPNKPPLVLLLPEKSEVEPVLALEFPKMPPVAGVVAGLAPKRPPPVLFDEPKALFEFVLPKRPPPLVFWAGLAPPKRFVVCGWLVVLVPKIEPVVVAGFVPPKRPPWFCWFEFAVEPKIEPVGLLGVEKRPPAWFELVFCKLWKICSENFYAWVIISL